ncbi:MAG: phage baseplate assembly protein V [Candidatus Methanoperedens sp.]
MTLEDLFNKQERSDEQHIYGVVVGIVTSNQDSEGLGRVKVSFLWRGDKDESYWARVASLMAGNDRGMVFYPEVNDEVLVAFEHGDINYPYVIGALWNTKDKTPEANSDGKNNIRKIRSRSGHEIIFSDEKMKERVEIHTNAKHKIILDDTTGGEKIEIIDKTGSNKITIDSMQNSINIESTMQLKIKSQMIEIEAGAMMTIKAGGILTIQGSVVKIN